MSTTPRRLLENKSVRSEALLKNLAGFFEMSDLSQKSKTEEQVKHMLNYGRTLCTGNPIGRGSDLDVENFHTTYRRTNKGPLWAKGKEMPTREQVETEGIICIGLLSLCLRFIGLQPPFLHFSNVGDGPVENQLEFGFGGTDEWLYYFRTQVETFNPHGHYPKGTLLFRIYNELDQGHVALLAESSNDIHPLLDCKVLHTGGSPLSTGFVSMNETVRMQHDYYNSRNFSPWDTDRQFPLGFENVGYYMCILKPEHYLPACVQSQ